MEITVKMLHLWRIDVRYENFVSQGQNVMAKVNVDNKQVEGQTDVAWE